jgi:hypothetical protein
MVTAALYAKFKETNCSVLRVNLHPKLGRGWLRRLRNCPPVKRRKARYWFGKAMRGQGKGKIGVSASLFPVGSAGCCLQIRWFRTTVEPPQGFGDFDQFAECFGDKLQDADARVSAEFLYAKERFGSLFKPIALAEQPSVFDEVIGVTGVKKGPEGKILYRLEISIEEKHVAHRVTFTRPVTLSADLPGQLLDSANSISVLALAPGGGV